MKIVIAAASGNSGRHIAEQDAIAQLAPLHQALYLSIRMVLSELPDNARILCVGVGTGSELIDLAQAFANLRSSLPAIGHIQARIF
ncbi:hypothetical protein [Scytonema sp. NUACC26]|uniref:hypothetical protein n=1 Tax=Scytonema sp. NUACC26 TaxID=3140176 RepID=UPI0034DC716B